MGREGAQLDQGEAGEGPRTAPHATKGAARKSCLLLLTCQLCPETRVGREVGPELQPENPGPHVGKF